MSVRKFPTDYRKLRNRCLRCGHRYFMHLPNGKCTVRNSDPNDDTNDDGIPCDCEGALA
jgi:hypothetical protein